VDFDPCAYIRVPHVHKLHMGYSDVSAGVRHLERPNNPGGLNFRIHATVYVYEVHMYIYAGRPDNMWTNCFASLNILFVPKKKRKRRERNTETSNPNGFYANRPCTRGTRPFFDVIKAIIISLPCVFAVRAILSITLFLP